jgi:hypothetical protein
MAWSLNGDRFGELVDPFDGMYDLEDCIIRTPCDPDITFSDDPLRMMRAIRFATQLGFNIEEETYAYWAKLLREEVKPDLMITGHTHIYSIDRPGCDNDVFGQPCTIVVASQPNTKEKFYAGGGVIFDNDKTTVVFSNQNEITYEEDI